MQAPIREELNRVGARPRRGYQTGVEALTDGELRVARLAAEGLSNPEIARELFISRKTVESHLRVVYRKLDIASREKLAAALDVAKVQGGLADASRAASCEPCG